MFHRTNVLTNIADVPPKDFVYSTRLPSGDRQAGPGAVAHGKG